MRNVTKKPASARDHTRREAAKLRAMARRRSREDKRATFQHFVFA